MVFFFLSPSYSRNSLGAGQAGGTTGAWHDQLWHGGLPCAHAEGRLTTWRETVLLVPQAARAPKTASRATGEGTAAFAGGAGCHWCARRALSVVTAANLNTY